MARKTSLIALAWPELCRIPDVFGRDRFGMFTTRSMTGFTALADTAVLRRRFDCVMRISAEGCGYLFVARLASFGSNIFSRSEGLRGSRRSLLRRLSGWLLSIHECCNYAA
jgi:hypothetical protein